MLTPRLSFMRHVTTIARDKQLQAAAIEGLSHVVPASSPPSACAGWLQDNAEGAFWPIYDGVSLRWLYCFESANEAFAFKMRWC